LMHVRQSKRVAGENAGGSKLDKAKGSARNVGGDINDAARDATDNV
jgi:hypothetical protein